MNDDLIFGKSQLFTESRLSSWAEVFVSRVDPPVVFKELDESSNDDLVRIFLTVRFFADGQLNVKGSAASERRRVFVERFFRDDALVVYHDGVLFLFGDDH